MGRMVAFAADLNRTMVSHAEVRAMHRRNGVRWSAHFDLRCSLAPKDVQQEFTRQTAESSRRFAWSSQHSFVGSGPLNLEPASVKPPTQIVAAAANVSPQGSVHCRRQAPGSLSIGSADVLVMNEEFVEIRQGPDPPDAEDAEGRTGPDPCYEPCEVVALGQCAPTPLDEPLEGARQDDARSTNGIAFSQYEVGDEIVSSPALEQGGSRRAELVEQITELKTLLDVWRNVSHAVSRLARAFGERDAAERTAALSVIVERHRAKADFAPGPNWLARVSAVCADAGATHLGPDRSTGYETRSGRRSGHTVPTGRRADSSDGLLRQCHWPRGGEPPVWSRSPDRRTYAPASQVAVAVGHILEADYQALEVRLHVCGHPDTLRRVAANLDSPGGAEGFVLVTVIQDARVIGVVRRGTDRAEIGEDIPDVLQVGRDGAAAVDVGHRLTVRGAVAAGVVLAADACQVRRGRAPAGATTMDIAAVT